MHITQYISNSAPKSEKSAVWEVYGVKHFIIFFVRGIALKGIHRSAETGKGKIYVFFHIQVRTAKWSHISANIIYVTYFVNWYF